MPVSISEIIAAQKTDYICQTVFATMSEARSFFFQGAYCVLRRRHLSIPEVKQIVVPETLRPRLLHLAHHSKMAGNSGRTRMFAHFLWAYYLPFMEAYITSTVRLCPHCSRERFPLIPWKHPMRLFPAKKPLNSVSVDLFSPLPKMNSGN